MAINDVLIDSVHEEVGPRCSMALPAHIDSQAYTVKSGELILPAPDLEAEQDGVLDPALSWAIVKVMPYPGMACTDKVVMSWVGIDSEGAAYSHKEQRSVSRYQVGREIIFVIRSTHIAAMEGGWLEVFYTLHSVLQGVPVESLRLQVQAGDVRQELLPATVDDAYGGWLDPDRVPEGARVTIAPYGGMSQGDMVVLSWAGEDPAQQFNDSYQIEKFSIADEVSFWVPWRYIASNLGSTVIFSYLVEHPGRVTRYSEPARLNVGVRPPISLALPDVLEADEGLLDLQDTLDGVTVVVDQARTQEGELVYLKCDGENFSHRDSRDISRDAADKPVVFIVPYRFWREHQGSTVRVSYRVERLDDASQESEVVVIRVQSAGSQSC
jgi:hypothetical protein